MKKYPGIYDIEGNETKTSSLIDEIEIINQREDSLFEAYVPIELIDQEDVVVDDIHVQELAASILHESKTCGTTGQLSPILLGYLPSHDRFAILDGFHRVPAVKLAKKSVVYATIKENCTPEDVVDLRILAASSHKKIKFARIIEWVEDAWATTIWADKIGVNTAFMTTSLSNKGTGRGSKGNGLTDNDVQDIKEWVMRKCNQWDLSVSYVSQFLQTAKVADPELVKVARERSSGHQLDAITPLHLRMMVKHLPNNYPMQQIVAEAAVSNNLTVKETQNLSLAISKAKKTDEIERLINTKVWERMTSAQEALSRKFGNIALQSTESEKYVRMLQMKFVEDQIKMAGIMIENAILLGKYMPEEDTASNRIKDLLILSEVTVDNKIEELPQGQLVEWPEEKIQYTLERFQEIKTFLINVVQKSFSSNFTKEDAEDAVQIAITRFYNSVKRCKLPIHYSNETMFKKLMITISKRSAIDMIRKEHGRDGQKPQVVSIHQDLNGASIEDRLKVEDPCENIGNDANEIPDLMTSLLPLLGETDRRLLIMVSYFRLTPKDIASILDLTSRASVETTLSHLRKKVQNFYYNAQLETIDTVK